MASKSIMQRGKNKNKKQAPMRHYCNSPYFSSKLTVHACTQILKRTVVYENVKSAVGRRIWSQVYIKLKCIKLQC